MTCNTKLPSQNSGQTAVRVNVSDLTPSQRKNLFEQAINQAGFAGFIKYQGKNSNQTHYAFIYSK